MKHEFTADVCFSSLFFSWIRGTLMLQVPPLTEISFYMQAIIMFLPRITQVELNNKSYIRERGVGQALFALKEEQGKSFYVNARVIPLCPMTAKVVPRHLLR